MKTIDIKAILRSEAETGKTGSKQLRTDHTIPCVVYFNGQATHIKIAEKEVRRILHSPETYLVNLEVEGGENCQAIVKKADFHAVKDKVLHLEFLKVVADQKVEVSLPIKFVGTAVGVIKGGKILQKLRKIKVKGFVQNLPDCVEVSVAHLDLGGNILIKDIPFKDIDVTSPTSTSVVSVEIPRSLRSTMVKGK